MEQDREFRVFVAMEGGNPLGSLNETMKLLFSAWGFIVQKKPVNRDGVEVDVIFTNSAPIALWAQEKAGEARLLLMT